MLPKCFGVKRRCVMIFLILVASSYLIFIGLCIPHLMERDLGSMEETTFGTDFRIHKHHLNNNNNKNTMQTHSRTPFTQHLKRIDKKTMKIKKDKKGENEVVITEYVQSNIRNDSSSLSPKVFPLFQSSTPEEFPTTDEKVPRIPNILHQIYANEMIPYIYIKFINSFIKHNPTWKYRFWTDASGRQFLQKHHPYLVKVFDNFGNNVRRSDLLRYAVLYEYGGFYADFDMENLRSLNRTTIKYACIFPVEPFEHSSFLYKREFLINNAFMACRPKHPFLKLLLSDLRNANPKGHPVKISGPLYVTEKFIQYNHIDETTGRNKTDWRSNSPFFYKGDLQEDDSNAVYVPNSQYFMDKIDPIHLTKNGIVTRLCGGNGHLSYLQERGCAEYKQRMSVRQHKNYTFTVHHWYHLWLKKKEKFTKVHIKDIVPYYIQYIDDN